jgi:RNA polymerase sigma-B factor
VRTTDTMPHSRLAVMVAVSEVAGDPAAVVVSAVGEIDQVTAPPLQDQLNRVIASKPRHLVIDLSWVSFLSAAGLSVLLNARQAAARQGIALELRAPNRRMVVRMLEITGLDHLFEIVPPITDREDTLEMPDAGEGDRDSAKSSIPPQSVVETDQDEYAHLVPLQRRYAALTPDHPERQRLRARLITGYLPVAEHLARRLTGRGEPLEDLIQVATVGLINAVDRFEPDRGSHFLAYAVPTITGELRRHFRDHGWSTRVPRRLKDLNLAIRRAQPELSRQLGRSPTPTEIAERMGVPVANMIEALHAAQAYRSSSLDALLYCGETTATPETLLGEDTEIGLIDEREALRPLLAQLAPRQRTILSNCGSSTDSPSARSVSGSASRNARLTSASPDSHIPPARHGCRELSTLFNTVDDTVWWL